VEFMTDEKHINACGVDEINDQIIRAARGKRRSARTILPYKKGDRNTITNS
jgi:hypothetical protein